jgi:hypothetical protein
VRVRRRRAYILRSCCHAVIVDLNQTDILTVLWCHNTASRSLKVPVCTYFEDKLGTGYDRIERIWGIHIVVFKSGKVTSLL